MKNQKSLSLPKLFNEYFQSVVAGLILALSFPKFSLWFLGWISLALPLWLVTRYDIKKAFKLGFFFGLSFFIASLYWIDIVLRKYGGLPFWLSTPVLLLLGCYLSLYSALFFGGYYFLKDFLPWLVVPSLWVLLEWLRGLLLTGFPWNLLAHSQGEIRWLCQIADITGAYGVSWIVLMANVLIAKLFSRKVYIGGWIFFIIILISSFLYGKSRLEGVPGFQPLTIGIIQGNIDQSQKWDIAFRNYTIDTYKNLSEEAVNSKKDVVLLVWPETAMPFFYGIEAEPTEMLDQIVKKLGVDILFGAPSVTFSEKERFFLNSAYLISGKGFVLGDYAKEHLVPFGEYVPLKKLLFFVNKLVPAAGDFVPGKSSGVITWQDQRIGMLICYEAIFPELSRRRVLAGATFLVNISNDAWFGESNAPYQHLEISRWRAIETRKPLVRATNTGISAFIDPTGKIEKSLGIFQKGFIIHQIFPNTLQTFYVKWGDLFVLLCGLIVAIAVVYSFWKTKRFGGGCWL